MFKYGLFFLLLALNNSYNMSQDLTGSATMQISKADINSLIYKQENISESLKPEMVKRAILHPIYNEDEELEERIYYSLHNDAARCTYISPHLRLEGNAKEIISAVPGNNAVEGEKGEDEHEDEIIPPIYSPTPPPPIVVIDPEEDEEDEEIVWPGGGGGGTSGGGSGGGSTGPSSPRTDFDNYAQKYVDWTSNPNITSVKDVTDFYENRSAMETAKNAMYGTRRPSEAIGHTINDNYANLVYADDMYAFSCVEVASIGVPALVNAPRMFKGAGMLTRLTLRRAKSLSNAESMCENCDWLKTFTLKDNHALSNAKAMFKNCTDLKTVNLGYTNGLKNIDHMFEGCKTPQVYPHKIEVTETATYAFANTKYTAFEGDFPYLLDASYMLTNAKKLKEVKNSSMSSVRTANGMLKNCTLLEKDSNLAYNALTAADEMYAGCKNLVQVTPRFPVLQNGKAFFKNCKALATIDFDGQFPSLVNGESMCEGCKALKQIVLNLSALSNANSMFRNCTGLYSVDIDCPAITTAVKMFEKANFNRDITFSAPAATDLTSAFEGAGKSGFGITLNINPVTTVQMFKDSGINRFVNNGNFENLQTATDMFKNCNKLVTIDFGEAPKLGSINNVFANCASLQTFTGSFPSITYIDSDHSPFENCPRLKTVNLTMAALQDGTNMFRGCSSLKTVNCSFPQLVTADGMFKGCSSLTDPASTPNVTHALGMYEGTAIFKLPSLPLLKDGRQIFADCKNLTGNISCSQWPELKNGVNMFNGCTGISSVSLDLSNAIDVRNMFGNCTNINSVSNVSFANGVRAQALLMAAHVDVDSFISVFNAIKNANAVPDVNGCICHVGVASSVIDELQEIYGGDVDVSGAPMFRQWSGNQYALRFDPSSNVFVMAVAN